MRLIDADKLKEAFPARHNNKFVLIADVRAAINQAPEVDAVPVIRCRECEYWHDVTPANLKGYQYCHAFRDMMPKDGYCHKAQRREVSK